MAPTDIGEPPAYLQPVTAPASRVGRSAFVVAAELEAALDKANVIIRCGRVEWIATRATLRRDAAAIDEARRAGEQCVTQAEPLPPAKGKKKRT